MFYLYKRDRTSQDKTGKDRTGDKLPWDSSIMSTMVTASLIFYFIFHKGVGPLYQLFLLLHGRGPVDSDRKLTISLLPDTLVALDSVSSWDSLLPGLFRQEWDSGLSIINTNS